MSAVEGRIAGRRIGLLTAWASRMGGGVFEAVAVQASLLRDLGARPVVIALADGHGGADAERLGAAELHHVPVLGPRFFGYAPRLAAVLDGAQLDLLHLHGIWMYPSQAASAWADRSGRALLISPHGMLDPWITARGRGKKAMARAVYERRAWRRARALHALTGAEAADITRESGRGDCIVIPNAGPAPVREVSTVQRAPVAAYLGRIHPKKNLHALINAWDLLAEGGALPAGARLDIAGWGDPQHIAALEARLCAARGPVRFLGPQFGADKARLLASARFLVLPSLSEGLPMAVLEAWAGGVPVLMSRACHLAKGIQAGAAIDCGIAPASIAEALAAALTLDHRQWLAMADAALGLASGPFSAAANAHQWEQAYAALIGGSGGDAPAA